MTSKLLVGVQLAWIAVAGLRSTAVIRVRVVDFAGVPEKTRSQAEKMVARILERTGLEVAWLDAADPGPADLRLQVLARPPLHLYGDTTGFAVLVPPPHQAESYAAVSYPMVELAANSLAVDPAEVLGAAMAHELGHLLLRSRTHSRQGVMSPRFGHGQALQAEKGELLFSDEEAARIRRYRF